MNNETIQDLSAVERIVKKVDALEYALMGRRFDEASELRKNLLDAVRQELAALRATPATAAEPVAWRTDSTEWDFNTTQDPVVRDRWIAFGDTVRPLYATPAVGVGAVEVMTVAEAVAVALVKMPRSRIASLPADELLAFAGHIAATRQPASEGRQAEGAVAEPAFYTNIRGSQPVAPWGKSKDYCIPLYYHQQPLQATQAPSDAGRLTDEEKRNGLAWAVHRWNAEVSNRPLQNIHRRTLDDTWRQVIRYFEGDPVKLLGQAHDDLQQGAGE